MTQKTLAIVKPDAVESGSAGKLLSRIEAEGFRIVALRMERLTREQAEGFYEVHRERPFFPDLTAFMSSGPCVVIALERDGAIAAWRELMGATDPSKAEAGCSSCRRPAGARASSTSSPRSCCARPAAVPHC